MMVISILLLSMVLIAGFAAPSGVFAQPASLSAGPGRPDPSSPAEYLRGDWLIPVTSQC